MFFIFVLFLDHCARFHFQGSGDISDSIFGTLWNVDSGGHELSLGSILGAFWASPGSWACFREHISNTTGSIWKHFRCAACAHGAGLPSAANNMLDPRRARRSLPWIQQAPHGFMLDAFTEGPIICHAPVLVLPSTQLKVCV